LAVLAGVPLVLATVLVVPRSVPPATAAVKTIFIPARWASRRCRRPRPAT
jgi:hypothetical protein